MTTILSTTSTNNIYSNCHGPRISIPTVLEHSRIKAMLRYKCWSTWASLDFSFLYLVATIHIPPPPPFTIFYNKDCIYSDLLSLLFPNFADDLCYGMRIYNSYIYASFFTATYAVAHICNEMPISTVLNSVNKDACYTNFQGGQYTNWNFVCSINIEVILFLTVYRYFHWRFSIYYVYHNILSALKTMITKKGYFYKFIYKTTRFSHRVSAVSKLLWRQHPDLCNLLQ